jgi:hypothetical protein
MRSLGFKTLGILLFAQERQSRADGDRPSVRAEAAFRAGRAGIGVRFGLAERARRRQAHMLDGLNPECTSLSAYWITVLLGASVVLSLAALGFAALGSRHAPWVSGAALLVAVLGVAVSVLVAYDAVPSGDRVDTSVRRFYAEQDQRYGGRGPHDAERLARERVRCLALSSVWALAPMIIAGAAIGLSLARQRAGKNVSA